MTSDRGWTDFDSIWNTESGVARIVFNQPGGVVNELVDAGLPVNDVRLEPVDR